MKILITGAAGFVGQHAMRHFAEDCCHSVDVTKLPQETLSNPYGSVYALDVLDADAFASLLHASKPDWILHLAAQSSVRLSWDRPQLTADINVKGTLNLLEAVRKCDPQPGILLIGSADEYGVFPGEGAVTEDMPLHPRSVYAVTKAAGEQLAQTYAAAYGMRIICVRAFNHIGPGQSSTFVVGDFTKQVAEIAHGLHEPLIRTGNLSAMRDFTDVRDIVHAYALLMEKGRPGEVYNIGSGHAIPVQQILEELQEIAKVQFTFETDPAKLRPVDIPRIEADVTKLRRDTGWEPHYTLRETLADTLAAWEKSLT